MVDWLGTYAHRVKVTASNTNVDSDQTHFPLLLTLGTSVGTGSNDVSFVFDELTSDANRTKIAVTKTDGTTELYVEIEKWDDANESAVLWVSKSDWVLDADASTELYLYYDSAHAANTARVGDTNAEVAENVWDSNYIMVQHMADGASTSATYDSTSNDNDGTKTGAAEPAVTTSGEIGNAQTFDGSNDEIDVGDNPFDLTDMTLQGWAKTSVSDRQTVFGKGANNQYQHGLHTWDDVSNITTWTSGGDTYQRADGTVTVTDNAYHLIHGTVSGTTIKVFTDGGDENSSTDTSGTRYTSGTAHALMGNRDDNAVDFAGIIDEVRVSNTARSADWIKADYYTQTDALVSWGSEEDYVTLATVTTQAVTSITETTATGNGNITDVGDSAVSAWGICWDTATGPTTSDDKAAGTGDGTAGAFTASLTGLTAGTLYYAKAYATNTEGTVYGAEVEFTTTAEWLGTYAKRIKVTASNTNVDSDLTHFPLLLTLGTSVGTGSDDVSAVFDELTSDANRTKIAITKTDGTTELYVEIEKWDDANEKAVLWVSKSDWVLDADATTDLYLYYDSAHAANTTYVADAGSRTEVWDSNYKGVWHLNGSYDGTADEIIDSTSNNNDGYACSGRATTEVSAKIGMGQDFDNDNRETLFIPDSADFDPGGAMTISIWERGDDNSGDSTTGLVVHDASERKWNLYANYIYDYSRMPLFGVRTTSGYTGTSRDAGNATTEVWHYWTATYDRTLDSARIKMYWNETLKDSANGYDEDILAGDEGIHLGGDYNGGCVGTDGTDKWHDGQLDEFRFSNIARSADWIKADYYTQTDALVSWGSEEDIPATGTNMQINIGDNWKVVDKLQINIGDVWKTVTKVQQNIGDVWKSVF